MPPGASGGNRATNKFKEFNADRMVSVQFNPSQQVKNQRSQYPKEYCGMVSGVIAAILTILLIVCPRDGIPLSSRKH